MDDMFSFWLGAMVATLHPGKLTWNPKSGGLEIDFPVQVGDCAVPREFLGRGWEGCIDRNICDIASCC